MYLCFVFPICCVLLTTSLLDRHLKSDFHRCFVLLINFFFYSLEKAVDITSCGNFAVIGMSTGQVDVYNMQSGIHRGHFGKETGKGS